MNALSQSGFCYSYHIKSWCLRAKEQIFCFNLSISHHPQDANSVFKKCIIELVHITAYLITTNKKRISLIWARDHSWIPDNEQGDQAANQATNLPHIKRTFISTTSDITHFIGRFIFQQRFAVWENKSTQKISLPLWRVLPYHGNHLTDLYVVKR